MRTTILLCALFCAAHALPPRPPPRGYEWRDSSQNIQAQSRERSDSEERESQAIISAFDALKKLSRLSGDDVRPGLPLLDKLRDIALASVADRDLSPEERNKKYTSAIFDELEEYARTSVSDEKERNFFLAILQVSRNMAKNQSSNAAPDKEAFLSFIENLFNEANAPFPGGNAGLRDQDPGRQELEKQNFLTVLDSVLDDIRM